MRKKILATLLIALGVIASVPPDVRTLTGGTIVASAQAQSGQPRVTNWPPNYGFTAPPYRETLRKGRRLDRCGQEGGSFLAPEGTPYEMRSLPYNRSTMLYCRYVVARPLTVDAGITAAWFGKPGGGTQYRTDRPVSELRQAGYLRRIDCANNQ